MNLLKIFLSATLLIMAFTMSGCQGNNSDSPETNTTQPDVNNTLPPIDTNSSKDPVTLQFVFADEFNVTSSGQVRQVDLRAFDASGTLNTEGQITVQYPQKPDAGTFSPNTATITDGIAHFTYTAPLDLQGRVDSGDTFSNYTFFSTTNGAVNDTLKVNYTPGSSIVIGDPILQQLTLSESNITISQSEQTYTLTLFAYTDQQTTDINLEVGIQFGDLGIDVGYFTPSSPSIVNGRVTLTYNGPLNLLNTKSSLSSTTFTLFDKANPGITVPLTVNFTPDTPTLRVESPTVILTSNSQAETVTVLAFDSNNQAFNSGTILVEYPDAITNGSVSGGTFTQAEANIVNGKAIFNFTGPNPLSQIATQTFTFRYKENQTVSTTMTMQYNPTLPTIDSLSINESVTTLTANSQVHTVNISALDTNGNFVNSGVVNVKFPTAISTGVDLGTFTTFTVNIVNGIAKFNYTAPSNLVKTSSTNPTEIFTFTDAADSTNTVTWTVNYTPDRPTLRVESPTVILTSDGQTERVTILAFDSANKAFNGGTIEVEYPTDITNGTFSGGTFNEAEVSIVNGKAVFTYVGPNPLELKATPLTFNFKYKEDATVVAAALSMNYTPNNPTIATLAINEVNTTISQDKQVHTVVINALDSTNNFVKTGTINVKFPTEISTGVDVGSFTELSANVVNGQATFVFTGPNDVQGTSVVLPSATFEFSDAASSASSISWNVTYNPDIPRIRLTNSSIDITQDSETVLVHVLGFDENNQSLSAGTISVAYPAEIINQNANGGRFLENEVEISNGEAIFTFEGPSTLENINPLTFTFSYKGNALVVTKDLNISYSPPTATVYLNNNTKEVTLNSETVNIDVDVRDAFNNPFPTGSVKIVYPDDVKLGRDIGSFISSEVTLVNGVASFVYTSPKNLDANTSDIVFKFYHDSLPAVTVPYTVTINPEPNQVILTDYYLTSSYSDGNITMNLDSTKLITFYIKDKDGNLLSDSNVTSVVATVLNVALADLADSNASNPAADTQTLTKNSASLSIISNTISGVVPIKTVATFKGVNNEDVNITEVFNVVIASGPPTAMSISYVSTSNDTTNAKFVEKMVVAITDKYSNRVNSNPGISVALIAGYADDTSGSLGYMYHESGATIDTTDDKIKVQSGSVMQVNLTTGGSNYSLAPDVSLANGDGNFSATAYLSNYGGISEVNIISGGKEYVIPPTVIAEGTGYGFSATAILASTGTFFTTDIATSGYPILTLDNPGLGYTSVPTVSVTNPNAGSGFDATAILESTGSISTFTINNGGSGYAVGDVILVESDCATSPTIKVKEINTSDSNATTLIEILNTGSGCTYANVDTLGTGDADISLVIGYKLKEVRLNNGGVTYDDPLLTVSGGGGSGAQVSSKIGFAVSSVTVDNIGTGYRSSAVVSFTNQQDGENVSAYTVVRYPVSYITITEAGANYVNSDTLSITNAAGDITGSGALGNIEVFADFSTVVENSGTNDDFLMTFGNGYSYNASGKWDITSTGANDEFERVLTDQYDGNTTTNLGFAVGNNFRQDVCINAQEWVGTASTPSSAFDSNGLAEIDITYDYYLAAKDIIISANLVGAQNNFGETVKIGEAIKHTLRGTGLIADTLNLPAGLSHAVYRMYIELDGALDQFRNVNFTYTVSSASTGLTIHRINDSMDDGIHSCPSNNDQGRAYVEVEVSTTLTATIKLENLVISREFK